MEISFKKHTNHHSQNRQKAVAICSIQTPAIAMGYRTYIRLISATAIEVKHLTMRRLKFIPNIFIFRFLSRLISLLREGSQSISASGTTFRFKVEQRRIA